MIGDEFDGLFSKEKFLSMKKAVVLSSGGLDSTTCLAVAKQMGFELYSMSFNYGQRHRLELQSAEKAASFFGVARHIMVDIDLRQIGGSALTSDIPVPQHRSLKEMDADIPITYVPARNTIFLSFALAWAEVLGAWDIFIGVNALDYSGYPDCRPEFIEAYRKMASLATKSGVTENNSLQIHTPLIQLSKADIIRKGTELGVDYSITHSCYNPAPDGKSCGVCDSCILRLKGFREAGLRDPLLYTERND